MTTGTIEKLHAAPDAQARPFRGIPSLLPRLSIEPLLASLGLGPQITIAAAAGRHLELKDLDGALTKHAVPVGDRIRLKCALTMFRLLS
jgi:hypothetical protein